MMQGDLSAFGIDDDTQVTQEENEMTLLSSCWLNERHSPELLPFHGELVEPLVRRIARQKRLIEENKNLDVNTAFIANLHLVEMERLKYILRSYLRARLFKIEKYTDLILSTPTLKDRLSPQEMEYANKYKAIRLQLLLDIGASQMPQTSTADPESILQEPDMKRVPDLDCYVVARIKKHLGEVQLDPISRENVHLSENQIYVLRYRLIQSLLADDLVDLV